MPVLRTHSPKIHSENIDNQSYKYRDPNFIDLSPPASAGHLAGTTAKEAPYRHPLQGRPAKSPKKYRGRNPSQGLFATHPFQKALFSVSPVRSVAGFDSPGRD